MGDLHVRAVTLQEAQEREPRKSVIESIGEWVSGIFSGSNEDVDEVGGEA